MILRLLCNWLVFIHCCKMTFALLFPLLRCLGQQSNYIFALLVDRHNLLTGTLASKLVCLCIKRYILGICYVINCSNNFLLGITEICIPKIRSNSGTIHSLSSAYIFNIVFLSASLDTTEVMCFRTRICGGLKKMNLNLVTARNFSRKSVFVGFSGGTLCCGLNTSYFYSSIFATVTKSSKCHIPSRISDMTGCVLTT
jgi:hypothetical protein